jgi:branched-chain amino acid transport system ATP-binding protein
MLLEVKDLEVHYGKAQALKGVSLTVNEGEVVALIGANGAGKTTLLRTVSGLNRLTSGEIWFASKRIDETPGHERVKRGIAHIPAGRRIFAELTVKQNLELGSYTHRDRREVARDIERMYEVFPVLKQKQGHLAGTLSGGEQQMLATSRGLVSNPRLVLMDEPSLGLSPVLVQEVGRIIQAVGQGRLSILLVEQNALLALRLASRAYVLELGEIVLEGNSSELVNDERVKKAYLGL